MKKGEFDISYCVDLLHKCELYIHILSPILSVLLLLLLLLLLLFFNVYLDYVDTYKEF